MSANKNLASSGIGVASMSSAGNAAEIYTMAGQKVSGSGRQQTITTSSKEAAMA